MSKLQDVRSKKTIWTRIVIYIACFIALVHFFKTFFASSSSPMLLNKAAFPWYTQQHPHLPPHNAHVTTHLSTKEREALTTKMVKLARDQTANAFPDFNNKIAGSMLSSEQADKFRALIECWTSSGSWVKMNEPVKVLSHYQDSIYGKCDRKHKMEEGQREALRYVWQSSCAPIKNNPDNSVSEETWCDVLRGRHVLVVGDLVQYQLHELFLDVFRDGPTACFGETIIEHTLCSEPHQKSHLKYLRNDILSTNKKMDIDHGHPRVNIIQMPFATVSVGRSYPIFILNRSSVQETDTDFIKSLIDTMKEIRKNNPMTLVIYRSSAIGHPFCDEASGPIDQLTDEEYRLLPYGWSETKRRNLIAKAIVEGSGGVYVDLGALADLRPDGHVGGQDCLRYCIPGPLDSWVHILYQVFLGLEGRIVL
ncbi:hypothetical protein BY458DRAFT_514428 [Sporodiniella umbellata]|nr:hypothetical protein BY458DRAFT_514428 [Sporodiniella umbellata]